MLRTPRTLTDPREIYIHASFIAPEGPAQPLRQDEMLFTLPSVGGRLQTLIGNWEAREALLGPIYDLYNGTIRSPAMYVEHQFTSFFQAIESYHRRTVPVSAVRPGEKPRRVPAKRRLTTIIMQCDAQWLFSEPLDEAVEHLVEVRDYFTHYLPDGDLHVPDLIDLYNDTVRMRLLLEMVLLQELGFDNQEIRRIFETSRRVERLLVTRFKTP